MYGIDGTYVDSLADLGVEVRSRGSRVEFVIPTIDPLVVARVALLVANAPFNGWTSDPSVAREGDTIIISGIPD